MDLATLRHEIYNKMYTVRVPAIATYDEFDLEVLGIPLETTGLDDGNRPIEISNQDTIVVGLPIIKLAEVAKNGYGIDLVNFRDITPLYKALDIYIRERAVSNTHSMNTIVKKDADIDLLDNLANSIVSLNPERYLLDRQTKIGFNDAGGHLLGLRKKAPKPELRRKVEGKSEYKVRSGRFDG
jgi:hypothetical protein